MIGEIVSVTASDQARLHGFFCLAESGNDKPGNAGTAIFVHGLSGNFYSSRLLTFLADRCVKSGVNTLNVNTRGHDVLNSISQSGRVAHYGAVFERVGDCVKDLSAWAKWVGNRVGGPVLLIGHSLGAIKSLFAMANQPISDVQAIIALSATRLNHQALLGTSGGERFRTLFETASSMVNSGRGDELMSVDFPFPTWMSAGAYREKYGPENHYDWFKFIDEVKVPSLLVFGERELALNPAFQGLEKQINQRVGSLDHVDSAIVEGADHFYSGKFAATWNILDSWLQSRSAH